MYDLLSKQDLHYSPVEWLEVVAENSSLDQIARDLATKLQSLTMPVGGDERCRYILKVGHNGMSLQDMRRPQTKPFVLDMRGMTRRSGGRDLLAKSVGRNCQNVIDATAGFGRDAFHLFHLGKHVTVVERSPVIAMILADAIERLIVPSPTHPFEIVCDESRRWLLECDRPEVIYMDPMFPDRGPRSALGAKELRILRSLVGDDADAPELLLVARSIASQRVVVKRPVRANPLGGAPDLEFKGRSVRYDVYLAES